ncbi:hypothetical protein CIL05_21720 [Virgibacillus profundi]|uniref:Uncharacterized protein n=1 Tax=Virgibacillus profundi TaxID=2024555 RepID=A0A2A2I7C5_9BACI|nr:hypothetical protein CIL05_21720 [Virgibacillus profundi]
MEKKAAPTMRMFKGLIKGPGQSSSHAAVPNCRLPSHIEWLGHGQGADCVSHNGVETFGYVLMILPQVHLRKPCYDFYFP